MSKSYPHEVSYQLSSSSDIVKNAVISVNIVNTRSGARSKTGINDNALGTTSRGVVCETCLGDTKRCFGHMGVCKLKVPVINPNTVKYLDILLNSICLNCGFKRGKGRKGKKTSEGRCDNCNVVLSKGIKRGDSKGENRYRYYTKEGAELTYVDIYDAYKKVDMETVAELKLKKVFDSLMYSAIPVPPPNLRLENVINNKQNIIKSQLTTVLKDITEDNLQISHKGIRDNDMATQKLAIGVMNKFAELVNGTGRTRNNGKINRPLGKMLAGKKSGFIRKNITGKRVNYVFRSVITGDSDLEVNQVGIPKVIAMSLPIVITVDEENIDRLRVNVHNRDKWPGCSFIETRRVVDGKITYKKIKVTNDPEKKYVISIGDRVHKHIEDGEYIPINRQPSLSPSSICALRAVVHDGYTIRLNISACVIFNADFDGDQMNGIVVNTPLARLEAKSLSSMNILSRRQDQPGLYIGAFQDTIISAFDLCRNNKIPYPIADAITRFMGVELKKKDVFTGKELVSLLLPRDINMIGKSSWRDEKRFEIIKGELIEGSINKANSGQGIQNSLFHEIANTSGVSEALRVLYKLQQMTKHWAMHNSITVSMRDLLLPKNTIEKTNNAIKVAINEIYALYEKLKYNLLDIPPGSNKREFIMEQELEYTHSTLVPMLEKILLEDIDLEKNGLLRIIGSGSKGSMNNAITMFSSVGYQTINGQFLKKGLTTRRYPSSLNYDTNPLDKGFIASSLIKGLSPVEFMSANATTRNSITNNALSTSEAGQQNRNANKSLESVIVNYFFGINNGKVMLEMLYNHTGFSVKNMFNVKINSLIMSDKDFVKEYGKRYLDRKKHIATKFLLSGNDFSTPFLMPIDMDREILNAINNTSNTGDITEHDVFAVHDYLEYRLPRIYFNERRKMEAMPEMKKAVYITLFYILTSISYEQCIKRGIKKVALESLRDKIVHTVIRALCIPGEPIGVISGYLSSEPITQSVLDSKHSTSGTKKTNTIVRIKEIITAKPRESMNNVTMSLFLLDEYKDSAQDFIKLIEERKIDQVINSVQIIYEQYGKSLVYPEENKYNKSQDSYINWCMRFVIDKEKIKSFEELEEIVEKLNNENGSFVFEASMSKEFDLLLKVYLSFEQAERVMNNSSFYGIVSKQKKKEDAFFTDFMYPLSLFVRNISIGGLPGIIRVDKEVKTSWRLEEDGSLKPYSETYLVTQGYNINAFFIDAVDEERSYTDSIVDHAKIHGIGATKEKIIFEMIDTLGALSPYHCSIYASQMTMTGELTPIVASGIKKREPKNVLLQASEKSPQSAFLRAAERQYSDKLYGITSYNMLGTVGRFGTNYFNISA